jgi:hypothetical protein
MVRCQLVVRHAVAYAAVFFCPLAIAFGQASYTVSNNSPAGTGSLRQAILSMNSAGISPATINFSISNTTISLAQELPAIAVSVSINPLGAPGIVVSGASAGSADGFRFTENTGQFSSITGLTIRNFQKSGIVISPANSNELVNVDNCYIHNCGSDGIRITGGKNHSISGTTVIQSNGGWGVDITNASVSGVQITGGDIQANTLGGVRFAGTNHFVQGDCNVSGNGSAEASDHRGGVVIGSPNGAATNCHVEDCTLALNTPYGLKRLSGSTGEARGNETYFNSTQGFKVLGAHPNVTLKHFVVDTANNQVIVGGTATGTANTSAFVEIFVPADPSPDQQGAAYIPGGDKTVALGPGGSVTFYCTFSRNAIFNAVALVPNPIAFQIDNTDGLVATATSSSSGSSEFSARSAATLPGDFDLDGDVDSADLSIWSANYGSGTNYWQGDATFDGVVDGADWLVWQRNFGQTP